MINGHRNMKNSCGRMDPQCFSTCWRIPRHRGKIPRGKARHPNRKGGKCGSNSARSRSESLTGSQIDSSDSKSNLEIVRKSLKSLAPRARFELATLRLTANKFNRRREAETK